MIKAIIFDCFGVLASDGWLPFREKYLSRDPILFQEATRLNKSFDAGLITFDDFVKSVAELAHVNEQDARKEIENNIPDVNLFTYISNTLKPKYLIGMLSNAGDNWLDEIFQPSQVALFDAVALSYETGIIKPNSGAYEIIASKLGVDMQECIFIDDQPKYCEGAIATGMQAIVYKGLEDMKRELKDIG